MTRTLALEGRKHGINANALMPLGATRMSATLPEPGATLFEERFPPEAVAPFVVWLAHEQTEVTNEIFSVGGGRAARVLFGLAPRVIPSHNTPEAWAAASGEVLSDELAALPGTAFEEAMLALAALGIEQSALTSPPTVAQ